jgi:PAS domain S-box-containing protein
MGLRPTVSWFPAEDQAGLEDLWQVYGAAFDEVWTNTLLRVQNRTDADRLEPPAYVLREQREWSKAAFAAGVAGDWGPYEDYLRTVARFYAARGVTFAQWFHVGGGRSLELTPRLVAAYGASPPRLLAALGALGTLTERTMSLLGTEYIAAKESALRHSERNLATTLDSIADAVIATDADGCVTRINPVAARLTGWPHAEAVGRHLAEVAPVFESATPELQPHAVNVASSAGKVVSLGETSWLLQRGGPLHPVMGTVAPIRDEDGLVRGTVIVFRDVTEARAVQLELRASARQLRALAARLQRAREEERIRISREIHDHLGQQLTCLAMDLGWLTRRALRDPAPADILERLRAMSLMLDDTMEAVRQVATELRPGVLDDLGLRDAVEWQAREFQRRSGVEVRVDAPDDGLPVDGEHATALFRCFQEILTNVSRHAGARRVDARLEHGADALVLVVADDGQGITAEQASSPSSLGLLGMRERVEMLGGALRIAGAAGRGTTVTIRVPLAPDQPCEAP